MAKTGRPSKYKKEYGAQLITHMTTGLSFESFGGVVGVNRDTLYAWAERHREFSDAKKRGEAVSRLFWEKMGIMGMTGKVKGFNVAAWIFSMKNRFSWRDKNEDAKEPDTSLDDAIAELDDSGE